MPSSSSVVVTKKEQHQQHENFDTSSWIITVSTVTNPSSILAGSQIPMSQIHDFPISFSLFKSNLVVGNAAPPASSTGATTAAATKAVEDSSSRSSSSSIPMSQEEQLWDTLILYYPKDLYVTAKICPKTTGSIICTNEDALYQGIGYSKLLFLPSPTSSLGSDENDDIDEFKLVRSAASIRLSQISTPDPLTTW